jgi:hypothetical protein
MDLFSVSFDDMTLAVDINRRQPEPAVLAIFGIANTQLARYGTRTLAGFDAVCVAVDLQIENG